MSQDLFSDLPGDGEEPDGSELLPATEEDGPDDDWDGPAEQGLYICLPPEHLTLAGFAQGGEADTMTPGPLLGTVMHTVAGPDGSGLAGCSGDQLMGVISAARRMAAWSQWAEMAAVAEFARRHDGSGPLDEFAPDELAFELHLTPQSAKEQMDYSSAVAGRLPRTFAALAAGRIHPVHVRIIEDETRFLSDENAAKADRILAETAPGLTFGEVRSAAHKLLLKLDPEAARKRKEAARGEAQVRRFREASGNAGMIARELPSDEVLASWQHVEQRALDLRAAGMPGTLQELRVRAYLDLLQERDSRDLPAASDPAAGDPADRGTDPDQHSPGSEPPAPPDASSGADGPGADGPGADGPGADGPGADGRGSDDSGTGRDGPDGPGGPDGSGGPGSRGPGGNRGGGGSHGPGGNGGPGGPGAAPGSASGPSVAALVTITIPLTTWQGRSETPGEADGFGVLDGDDARDLAAAAARHPRTRWCLTAVNPDGTAAAHACLPGRHPPPGLAGPAAARGPAPPPGTGPPGSRPPRTAP
jgi:hypothetical protein